MITVITVQLILYPIVFVYNFFTNNFEQTKYLFKDFYYAFDGSVYFIYLLRSLRLVYAHEIDTSRSKSWIFKFFKHEYYLVLFTMLMMLVKVMPIVFSPHKEYNFYTFLELNFFTNQEELGFGIKQIIH